MKYTGFLILHASEFLLPPPLEDFSNLQFLLSPFRPTVVAFPALDCSRGAAASKSQTLLPIPRVYREQEEREWPFQGWIWAKTQGFDFPIRSRG